MENNGFDREYIRNFEPRIEKILFKSFEKLFFSLEDIAKIRALDSTSILYVSTHKSHLDYGVASLKFSELDLPYPRFIGGENLTKGFIARSIKRFTKADFIKAGAVPIKRTNTKEDLLRKRDKIQNILQNDIPVLVYPEDAGDGKTGRSYDGRINKFSSLAFESALRAAGNKDTPTYIVPMTVSYDFVAEETYYPRLRIANSMRKSKNKVISTLGKMYYVYLESRFFFRLRNLGAGSIYVDVGQPIHVDGSKNRKELASETQKQCEKMYRVNNVALVAHALNQDRYNTLNGLVDAVSRDSEKLSAKGVNVNNNNGCIESKVMQTLQMMGYRDIINDELMTRGREVGSDDTLIKRRPIVQYYSNTIEHHFRT